MTNSETIENAKMLHGIEEELHTFAKWKELGYIPQKGQHAIIKRLWKSVTKLSQEGKKKTKMFMTTTAFQGYAALLQDPGLPDF